MKEYNVAYKGLRSTQKEKEAFIGDGFLGLHTSMDGFQRGLIVVRNPEDLSIVRGYSVVGYFFNNDGEAGNIQFEKESKSWDEREVREKLRRGKVLEAIVELDEDGNVSIKNPNIPQETIYTMPLEQHLMEEIDAFPRLSSKHIYALVDEFSLVCHG